MLPTIHSKCEIEPNYIPVTLVNVLDDQVQLAKHVTVGSLKLYSEYPDKQNTPVVVANQIEIDK